VSTPTVPVVTGRAPCPCGSGRRYKACHGRQVAAAAAVQADPRPFAGRVDEADLVALREIVPSATAILRLRDGREGLLGTALPLALPAMVRESGTVLIGLQTPPRSGDLGRDLGQAIEAALEAEPGTNLDGLPTPGPGSRFNDLVPADRLDITVHSGFDWWLETTEGLGETEAAALAEANGQVVPTSRLTSVEAAYWCRIGHRAHLRWAMPQDEEPLLDAFARLHHARAFDVGPDTRFVGGFRACGLVIPVWDLPSDREARAVEEPAAALAIRLQEALAESVPLTAGERASRAGIVSRQLTLR